MPRTLDLRRLRYFLVIAEKGSISAASRALNVAQPALSYHVSEMERLSGVKLLTRGRGGSRLTVAGELLRSHAVEIGKRVDAAEAALEEMSRKNASVARLRIAIITSLAADLTPKLVRRMRDIEIAPVLSIIEAGTRDIETRLRSGRIDLALCLAAAPDGNDDPIAREELVVVAPAGSADEKVLTLSEIADHKLVLPALGNPLRDFIEHAARHAGISLDVVLEVDGAGSRYNAVVNGIGCTFLGAHSIPGSAPANGLCVLRIGEPGLHRPIFLRRRQGLDQIHADVIGAVMIDALTELGLSTANSGPRSLFMV